MTKWNTSDIPDQTGRTAIVTGANTGLGYETAAALAAKGAHVVLAVRNLDKGKAAAERISAATPHAEVTLQQLDLTSLASIAVAAADLRAAYPRIDLLINNAGVMTTPRPPPPTGSSCSSAPTTSATSRSPGRCWRTCCRSRAPAS